MKCMVCGTEMPILDGRSRRRKHCSTACKNATRRAQAAPTPCACGCGQNPKNLTAKYITGHRPRQPLAERLWARVTKQPSGCWEWQGHRRTDGYGQLGRGGRDEGLIEAHRASWELTHGPIPEGLSVCHRCDNPPCCNPDHLFLGSPADNVADAVAKGRVARGERLPQTKLSDDDVFRVRLLGRQGVRQAEIARRFGVSQGHVSALIAHRYRKAI